MRSQCCELGLFGSRSNFIELYGDSLNLYGQAEGAHSVGSRQGIKEEAAEDIVEGVSGVRDETY